MRVCLLNESFPPVIDGVVNVMMNYADYMMRDYGAQVEVGTGDALALEDSARRAYMMQVMRYGLIVVSSVPMLIIYPFVQKYFVQGVMIGALKG